MARKSNGRYDRDFADPLQLPPEPIGWWGLSRQSRRWARNEDRWGTSERGRERELDPRGEQERRWGGPGYGLGGGRRSGAWERPPESYDRGWSGGERRERGGPERHDEWRSRAARDRRWHDDRPAADLEAAHLEAADWEHGTGAWGPGQAEPGLWGEAPEPRAPRTRRRRYDRDLGGSELRGRGGRGGIEWSGWGYEAARGERPAQPGRPRRTSSDEWGQYGSSGGERAHELGAWDYGRHREHMLEATGEAARRRWRLPPSGRPDSRGGEGWKVTGPERSARERRPQDRERWSAGRAPYGREYREEFGPPARGGPYDADYGW